MAPKQNQQPKKTDGYKKTDPEKVESGDEHDPEASSSNEMNILSDDLDTITAKVASLTVDEKEALIADFKSLRDYIPKAMKAIDKTCADERAKVAETRLKAKAKARNEALKASKASKRVGTVVINVRLPSGRYIAMFFGLQLL